MHQHTLLEHADHWVSPITGPIATVGLTQQFVEDKLGRPQSFVAKYEQGERRLDVIELVVVCDLVGADAHDVTEEMRSRLCRCWGFSYRRRVRS